ncbi:hypothetical protein M529_14445 [Sphingobium ummariense RL-3]|uniref:Uncharacterized protein n=1 Tax=Sphingobium ummariense RL-3 TaxID=1346791 RepID=T0K4H1_9SPHN|nr:hypothetical protein M529_14445 [Sphingobium ummariense RL-3]
MEAGSLRHIAAPACARRNAQSEELDPRMAAFAATIARLRARSIKKETEE